MKQLLFLFALTLGFSIQAQRLNKSIDGIFGMTDTSPVVSVGFNKFSTKGNYAQFSLTNVFGEDDSNISFNVTSLDISYNLKLYRATNNKFSCHFGLGGLFGYELINNGDSLLADGSQITDEDKFIYGALGTLTLDLNIANNTSLIAKANQYYHINSDVGEYLFYVGVGLRYYIF